MFVLDIFKEIEFLKINYRYEQVRIDLYLLILLFKNEVNISHALGKPNGDITCGLQLCIAENFIRNVSNLTFKNCA